MEFPLSQLWFESFYPELTAKLKYSYERDAEARDELAHLLEAKRIRPFDWESLEVQIKGSTVFIFGAGPSLVDDINCLYPVIRKSLFPIIAADGAIDALSSRMIFPCVLVSDLDSASEKMLVSQSVERALFIHAHGDNQNSIKRLVPKFGERIFGTTQVESIELVQNLGGLTDGDRSCYLASALSPRTIVLAGMDFCASESKYSKNRGATKKHSQSERKTKLDLGRKSLEFLIANTPTIKFLNLTTKGQRVAGAVRMDCEELIREIS
ncbi:MAG: 6-hydroxymethylpterin diphosphokinase MptE-like protein [Nitrososphaerales archaeon]